MLRKIFNKLKKKKEMKKTPRAKLLSFKLPETIQRHKTKSVQIWAQQLLISTELGT